ncbi:MAG: Gfo/Idh/MocA family oxidoreductase [Clostridiales bacterium]|jgi:predicted dehydrogenase|nr:Gfo/Idh/MocA family oxidoreductase [Clostridiales bacterium]
MTKIKFGIIGCGNIAQWHANAIRALPNAELAAVCDSVPDMREKFGREHGVQAYASEEQLLASKEIDAVCICTPSGLHAGQAVKALRAGKHVLAEKPFAITPDSLEMVLETARKTNRKLSAVSQMRFIPDVLRAREIIRSGGLGKILLADLSMKYYRKPSYYADSTWRGTYAMDGGGALMNQGIHGVDLLRFLCGEVRQVSARSRTLLHSIEAEDTLCADFELENGGLGVLTAATSTWPGCRRRLEICGSEGLLTLTEGAITGLESQQGELVHLAGDAKRESGESDPFNIDFEPHVRQIGAFVQAVLRDEQPSPDPLDAANTLRLIFAVYDSAESNAKKV